MASASLSYGGIETARADGGDHHVLVGVAVARDEPLDRADGNTLIGDVVVIAPRGQDRQPSSERMCRVDAGVIADLFVDDEVEAAGLVLDLGEPALEAQEPHAAALPAVQPELGGAAGDARRRRRQSRSR